MRNNVKVLPILLIITCAACGQVPQPFQKTELQKVKDRELLAPTNRSLFVKGINGPVGWVGNAFAEATADVLRRKGLLASSTWHNDQSFALTANGYQQLYEDRSPDLIVTWLLTDNIGRVKKTIRTKSTPPREFWINPTMQTFRQVIENVNAAVEHVLKYGTMHTDSIITENKKNAEIFLNGVNSSIAMHNVSTQFADGGEFGFGGEIGISTNKLPPRGPVGINQLTSYKYIVSGKGIIRP